jgi:hypothetical protein
MAYFLSGQINTNEQYLAVKKPPLRRGNGGKKNKRLCSMKAYSPSPFDTAHIYTNPFSIWRE